MNKNSLLNSYCEKIRNGQASVFVGAGLSLSSGCVNWKDLMRPIADELELDIDKETDYLLLSQYYVNEHSGNKAELIGHVLDKLNVSASPSYNHKLLSEIQLSSYWTTNYDEFIEEALIKARRIPDIKVLNSHFSNCVKNRVAAVYKMHGDLNYPERMIICKDDYDNYLNSHALFHNALSNDLSQNSFLFVGFSFSDPNIANVLNSVKHVLKVYQNKHIWLESKLDEKSFGTKEQYAYALRKQSLTINNLKRFNIHTILLDGYSEIQNTLEKIRSKLNLDNVFVSGSVFEYGDWNEREASKFLFDLGQELVKDRFNIITGDGFGVGKPLISGAYREVYVEQNRKVTNEVVLKPFPMDSMSRFSDDKTWNIYRKEMIESAGASVFVFGNVKRGESIEVSDGVLKEYKECFIKNIPIFAIGSTGFAAKKIWDEVMSDFNAYFPKFDNEFYRLYECLGEERSPENLLVILKKLLSRVKKCS